MTCSFQQPVIGRVLGEAGNGLKPHSQCFRSDDLQIPNMAGKSEAEMVAYLNDFAALNAELLPKLLPKPLRQSHGTNHKYGNISWRANNSSKQQTICNSRASAPILALRNRSSNLTGDNSNSLQVRGSYDMDPLNEHGDYAGNQQHSSTQYPTAGEMPRTSAGGSEFYRAIMTDRDRPVMVSDGLKCEKQARIVAGNMGDVKDTRDKYFFNTSASDDGFLVMGDISVEAAKEFGHKPIGRSQTAPMQPTPQPDTLQRSGTFASATAPEHDLSYMSAPRQQFVQMAHVDQSGLPFRIHQSLGPHQPASYPYMAQYSHQSQIVYYTVVDANPHQGQYFQSPNSQQYYAPQPNGYS